jgi:hypothetical protein
MILNTFDLEDEKNLDKFKIDLSIFDFSIIYIQEISNC